MSQAKAGQSTPSFDGKRIFPTPNFEDKIVMEIVSRKLENYTEVPDGTAHPETSLFPNHRLTLQVEQNEELVVRYYAADRPTQQTFSANISYSGESATHPIYSRDHLIRRSAYVSTARATPLSGLIDADVTAGGTGYEPSGTTPAVTPTTATLSGGTGSGGAVSVIVNAAGVVIGLYVTAVGNYTAAPNVTINGTGAGATGTVSIQPQGAVLVKEDVSAKTGDERVDGLYVLVRFVYETLPGPWIPISRWDLQLGRVQGRKRAVLNTGQEASLTQTLKTTYQGRNDSSIVLWEIEETYSNGSGGAGNPLFPVITSSFYDPNWKTIVGRAEQLTASTGNVAFISEAAGTVTKVTYQKVDEFHENRITDTWQIADEDFEFWDFVSLPTLVFDVVPNVFCNDTPFFTVVLDVDKAAGMTCLRKHRKTVTYAFGTKPDPDLSGSSFEPGNVEYHGKMIQFQFANALIDALAFSGTICHSTEMDACCWDEEWDFAASTPDATTFAAGAWYVREHRPELIDANLQVWRTTKIEYYSAPGEPP